VSCTPGPNATCPGLGTVLRVQTANMQGEKRRCVMVRIPEQGSIELKVNDRETLDFLTGTILALPGRPKGRPRFRIDTTVDSKQEAPVFLGVDEAMRPHHPKPRREIRFRFTREGPPNPKANEVCLQLTALFSQ
jgi:hypothetical protein